MPVTPIIPGERDEVGKGEPFGTGSREPGPTVPASGFDPSRMPDLIKRARLAALSDRTLYGGDAGNLFDDLADALCVLIKEANAFAAANPSGGWRPIETAPASGPILLSDGREISTGIGFFGTWASAEPCLGDPLNFEPTHWMPLPAPPNALAGDARRAETEGLGSRASDGEAGTPEATPSPPLPNPPKGQEETPCPMTVEEARQELAAVDLAFEGLEETDRARRIGHWIGLAAEETTRANAAEADRTRLEAENERLRVALAPFVGTKLPSLRRTERDYDRTGLRRMMSPMEIACKRALFALAQPQPEESK